MIFESCMAYIPETKYHWVNTWCTYVYVGVGKETVGCVGVITANNVI